jgi:transcriptional regulator with XRE-family HTH domain
VKRKAAKRKPPAKNLVGPQVRKWRDKKGWSQEKLALRLQLRGWNISRDSLASLESQRRRVPDCELLFLAKALGVGIEDLFPRNLPLSRVGPQFQAGERLAVFPTRSEK